MTAEKIDIASIRGPIGPQGLEGDKGDTGDQGPRGPQGIQGATGNPGTNGVDGGIGQQGPVGNKGPTGDTGEQGIQGLPGAKGTIGDKGATGNTGTTGLAGVQGQPGAQGSVGDKGAAGDRGLQGATGLTGATGATGAAGDKGATGDRGFQGLTGFAGPIGDPGVKGPTGDQGVAGPAGDQGPNGIQGLIGPTGNKGATGDIGATGLSGNKGVTGDAGPTGVQGAVGNKGPDGNQGPVGNQGPDGGPGAKGDTGATGPQGIQGVKGDTGTTGAQGVKGDTGTAGSTGATGSAGVTPIITTTSSSLITPAVASRDFTVPAGLAFSVGQYLRVVSASNAAVYMGGQVSAYSGTTLTIAGLEVGTATASSDWIITLSGPRGFTGSAAASTITTSVTSQAIATGSKTFVMNSSSMAFGYTGAVVRIINTGSTTNYMVGTVTAVSGTSLTVNVLETGGTGTFTAWTATAGAYKGATGANGTNGADGAVGATGSQGIQGVKGDTGTAGTNGSTGAAGVDAKKTATTSTSVVSMEYKVSTFTIADTLASTVFIVGSLVRIQSVDNLYDYLIGFVTSDSSGTSLVVDVYQSFGTNQGSTVTHNNWVIVPGALNGDPGSAGAAGATGPTGPAGPVTVRRQVTSRASFPSSARLFTNSGSNTQVQQTMSIQVTDDSEDFVFTWQNANRPSPSSAVLGGLSAISIRAGLYDGVNTYPIFWPNGSRDMILEPGASVDTKPVMYKAIKGQRLLLVWRITWATAPASFPGSCIIANYSVDVSEWGTALTDRTTNYAAATMFTRQAGNYAILPPVSMAATGIKRAVVAILGDSITSDGVNDFTTDSLDYGWAAGGLGDAGIPYIQLGTSSLLMTNIASSPLLRSQLFASIMASGVTHLLLPLGTNDWASGRTAAAVLADANTIRNDLRTLGVKVIPITLQPKTDSTNTTNASGEPNTFAQRALYNASIIANNGLGDGYFDLAALTQSGSNANLWRTDLRTLSGIPTIASGGTGYSQNDVFELPGGVTTTAVTVASGVVTAISILSATALGGWLTAPTGSTKSAVRQYPGAIRAGGVVGTGFAVTYPADTAATPTPDGTHPTAAMTRWIRQNFTTAALTLFTV